MKPTKTPIRHNIKEEIMIPQSRLQTVTIDDDIHSKITPVNEKPEIEEEYSSDSDSKMLFINFLCRIEGWKTKTKNLHWASRHNDIHTRLDEFYDKLDDYSDNLAESFSGILGPMNPNDIVSVPSSVKNPFDLIEEIREETIKFLDNFPKSTVYVGIKSETETFMNTITSYNYLFGLCTI